MNRYLHKILTGPVTFIRDNLLYAWRFFWKPSYKVTLWQVDPFLEVEIKGEPGESHDSVLKRGKIEFAHRLAKITQNSRATT
jgi:uncharacterized secreted protein with C-terminal beta-propeller domain